MRVLVGIYLIINAFNGKLYIGSSINSANRFIDHRSMLNAGVHKNKHLRSAWNFYGAEAFHFCVVEECSKDDLLKIEQLWINGNFENLYNLSPTAGNGILEMALK